MLFSKSRTSSSKYRKIYERHHGPIPREENGRTYEIHHVDGNHENNDPLNLVAVTLQEHYDLHYAQGDYQACRLMAIQRMNKTPEEISELSKLAAINQLKNGTHVSQKDGGMNGAWEATRKQIKDGTHQFLDSDFHKVNNAKRIANGTHHFLKSDFQKEVARKSIENGTNKFSDATWQKEKAKKQVQNGTHSFLGGEIQRNRIKNGTHPSQLKWTCVHCNVSGKGKGNFTRYHGDNCPKS